ncbi:MAG: class I SAM-dependent methyltransferase [Clostridiales bacterium]
MNNKKPVLQTDNAKPIIPTDNVKTVLPTDNAKTALPTDKAKPISPTDKAKPISPTDNAKPIITKPRIVKPIVELAFDFLEKTIKLGDIAVDATMGNGNDTVKLAQLVGETGKVFAFDIQTQALENTKAKLAKNNLTNRVKLLKENHCSMADFVPYGIAAAVFNLGYLPNGDHTLTTNSEDTLKALESAVSLLKTGGILVASIYWGHPQGEKEKNAILGFLKNTQRKSWNCLEISIPNREKAPILLLIEKN